MWVALSSERVTFVPLAPLRVGVFQFGLHSGVSSGF
jgi:hypothetical protein